MLLTIDKFQKYICVDPGFFSTLKRFESLSSVLDNLKTSNSQIVLPSLLKSISPYSDNFNEKISSEDDAVKLLQSWNSSFNKKDQSDIIPLKEKIMGFFQKFNPVFADDVIADSLNDDFLNRENVLSKLGKFVGATVYEFIQITSKKTGIIVGYGKKLISYVRKIGIAVLEGFSKYKHYLIDSGYAPKHLKIIGVFRTVHEVNSFSNAFDVVGLPVPLQTLGDLGLTIVANG
jgi:hypothetical protein